MVDFLFPKDLLVEEIEQLGSREFLRKFSKQEQRQDTLCIFPYRTPEIRTAIWELKYQKNRRIARHFAFALHSVLTVYIRSELKKGATAGELGHKICIIPIPLSKRRRAERGYNQLELVLEELARIDPRYEKVISTNILIKTRETRPQSSLASRGERLKNLQGCFALTKNAVPCLQDKHVVLIDDVVTTGATLEEAKRVFTGKNATSLQVIVLAY